MLANLIRHFFPGYKTKKELKEEIVKLMESNARLVADKDVHTICVTEIYDMGPNHTAYVHNKTSCINSCNQRVLSKLAQHLDYRFITDAKTNSETVTCSIAIRRNYMTQ